jgi:hypothetical protein
LKSRLAGSTAILVGLTVVIVGIAACSVVATAARPDSCEALFDDFNYSGSGDMLLKNHGWTVRTDAGRPGVPASWSASNISFPIIDGARSLQLQASTDGTSGGTSHAEIYHQAKFFEGTYAARVKFDDLPVSGVDGDRLVETFFAIAPLNAPMDPDFGEVDFEYLPNGGWGEQASTLFQTTWETYQPEPLEAINSYDSQRRSFAGWHELVFTVSDGRVKYYVDGALVADHGDIFYSETPMSINFNLWFISTEGHLGGVSTYRQQVDYVLHSAGEVLSPAEVTERVVAYRTAGVGHTDTMGAGSVLCPASTPSASPPARRPATLDAPTRLGGTPLPSTAGVRW